MINFVFSSDSNELDMSLRLFHIDGYSICLAIFMQQGVFLLMINQVNRPFWPRKNRKLEKLITKAQPSCFGKKRQLSGLC